MNAKNFEGYTPLHWAAWRNSKEAAEVLIRMGADVNAKNTDGKTPMDLATSNKKKEMIEILKARGAK